MNNIVMDSIREALAGREYTKEVAQAITQKVTELLEFQNWEGLESIL
jgi:hypothetical protein